MKAADLLYYVSIFWLCGLTSAFALDENTGVCLTASAAIGRKIPPEIDHHLQDWVTIANIDRILQM
jgi:hypothetical protein